MNELNFIAKKKKEVQQFETKKYAIVVSYLIFQ